MPVAHKLFEGTRVVVEGTILAHERYTVHRCGTCGITWAMPDWYLDERKEDRRDWHCPNGHLFHFEGIGEKEKLRRDLKATKDRLAAERARADQIDASLRATKGVVTRQRRKLEKMVAGVCPVDGCKRHFKDLRRHIESKHPNFKGEVGTTRKGAAK